MRAIYYFFKSLFIILFIRKTKVTPTCRIKAKLSNVGKKTCFCHHCFFNGKIGKYTSIGPYSRIDANIGNYCSVGPNVKTVSACHPIDFFSISPHIYRMFKEQLNPTFKEDLGLVSIGNDVWIGENVLIKGGVKIGNGAVIGMGAVVLDDVPSFAVVGGVPAKVIKYRFDKETIEKLNKSKWWEKNPSELKDKR